MYTIKAIRNKTTGAAIEIQSPRAAALPCFTTLNGTSPAYGDSARSFSNAAARSCVSRNFTALSK